MEVSDCEDLRRQIKPIAERLAELYSGRVWPNEQREVVANATLAYRHLEDASMRIGKCIQALDKGSSVYDRTQVPKIEE